MTEKLFKEINEWQENTFPQATALSKAYHLEKEVHELIQAIETNDDGLAHEYADCFLLLYGSAYKKGMDLQQINSAIHDKLQICMNRKWGEPDANGVVEHVEEKTEQICYKTKQPCKYGCNGLCKESY